MAILNGTYTSRKRPQSRSGRQPLKKKEINSSLLSRIPVDIRAIKTEEEIVPSRALEAVLSQRDQPAVSGYLMKLEQSWMGLGESKWKERYVDLDPTNGSLTYWTPITDKYTMFMAMADSTAPMQQYNLGDLIGIDTNEYNHTIILYFCRSGNRKQCGQGATFQAKCKEDFDRWVEVLRRYGMKKNASPTAARAA